MTTQTAKQGIDTILATASLMAKDTCKAQDVARHLGQAQGDLVPNVPLKVKPSDSAFSAARVAHSVKGEPSQVTLDLAKPLPMASLVTAFGPYDKVPRLPNPNELPRVSFELPIDHAERTVTLFASYESDDHDAASSTVSRITLFRD